MMTPTILRVGALAAILSVLGLLAVDVVSLDWDGPPDVGASSVLAAGDVWMAVWLVQLAGILLAVLALTVVFRTLERSEGGGWARLCPPLLIVSATLLCVQNLINGSLSHLADAASNASPAVRASYLAAFDAVRVASEFVDFGAVIVLGMLLVPLATAILVGHEYRHWIGWLCALAATLVLVGIPAQLAAPDAAVIGGIGIELFLIAMIALGVSMWRRAARHDQAAATVVPSGLDPATAAR
jgi:hypothetical protein